MDISLIILAAGIGSRFGGGVKQLEPVGPNGELIIDYSVHDAVRAGFNKIVFVIRRDIESDFREVIGDRTEKLFSPRGVNILYAYQNTDGMPEGRKKPWGTGQALLSCDGLVDGPFAVINADDYYGREGFVKAHEFLTGVCDADHYGMIGYILKNTLSDNGGVTRGICRLNEGRLVGIDETKNIVKTPSGAETGGRQLELNSLVSMNFWMLPQSFFRILDDGFSRFLAETPDPVSDEYLLPVIIDRLLKADQCSVSVLPSTDSWFGVTYKQDIASVKQSFRDMYRRGVYDASGLYADLR